MISLPVGAIMSYHNENNQPTIFQEHVTWGMHLELQKHYTALV